MKTRIWFQIALKGPHVRRGLLTVLLTFMAIMVFLYDPEQVSFFPPCPFHFVTGLFCPGCGSTRALHHLLRGHFLNALAYNPLAVIFIPVIIWESFARLMKNNTCFHLPTPRRPAWLAWCIVIVVLLFAALRNIPMYPFTILAPGG